MNKKLKIINVFLLILSINSCYAYPIIDNISPSTISSYYAQFNNKDINNLSPKIIKEKIILNKPEEINSENIKKEINKINSYKINSDEEYRITYWSNPISRWSEIAKDLGKKYNKNDIYLYTVSKYLEDSQYDTILNVYKNKYLYNRGFKENFKTPSYPAEKSALSEVSANILTYFYPEEKDFLNKKAIENNQTAFWGKENIDSDIKGGVEIGKKVSEKVIEIIILDQMKLQN